MFNKIHAITDDENSAKLAFVKSANVQVYPCGRRRSQEQESEGTKAKYRIPFDPEARLNTELNNRKHSSLNGFTSAYLLKQDWDTENLSLVLGNYSFNIKLDSGYQTENDFGEKVLAALGEEYSTSKYIFANIRIEETKLFEGFTTYYTEVLRDQSREAVASESLDLLIDEPTNAVEPTPSDYYFSGLSFSTTPLSGSTSTRSTYDSYNNDLKQHVESLCILEKDKTSKKWKIHQPALLPDVKHGNTANSVKIGTLEADKVLQNGNSIRSVEIIPTAESNTWRLTFPKNKN